MKAAGVLLPLSAVAFVKPTLRPIAPVAKLFAADAFPAAIANTNVAPANEILFIISPVIEILIRLSPNCGVFRLPIPVSRWMQGQAEPKQYRRFKFEAQRNQDACRINVTGSGSRYLLKLSTTTPALTISIPSHSLMLGRSFKKMTAKIATSTRLNLSTGATLEASPDCRARK